MTPSGHCASLAGAPIQHRGQVLGACSPPCLVCAYLNALDEYQDNIAVRSKGDPDAMTWVDDEISDPEV